MPAESSEEEEQSDESEERATVKQQRASHKLGKGESQPVQKPLKKQRNGHPDDSEEFEEVSEADSDDEYDSEEEDSDGSPDVRAKNVPQQAKKGNYVGHHRLSSKHYNGTVEDYDSELDQTMQTKYIEQQSMQQKKKGHQEGKTTFNPDFEEPRGTIYSRTSVRKSKPRHKHNKSI